MYDTQKKYTCVHISLYTTFIFVSEVLGLHPTVLSGVVVFFGIIFLLASDILFGI